jgi:hypothetical protein
VIQALERTGWNQTKAAVLHAMSNIKRILCPIDFSEESAHAIQEAIAVAGS